MVPIMTEPIHLQVNVLQIQDASRLATETRNVAEHQAMGQEMSRAKEAVKKQETVQTSPESGEAKLDKDGSGRGRAFQRQHRQPGEKEEEDATARAAEPDKGVRVDFVR